MKIFRNPGPRAVLRLLGAAALSGAIGLPPAAAADAVPDAQQPPPEQKPSSGVGGFLRKLSPLVGALPAIGSVRGGSGGIVNAAAAVAQQAATSAATSAAAAQAAEAQQQASAQPAGAATSGSADLQKAAAGGGIDCAQIGKMNYGAMSEDSCRRMIAAQKTYDAAAADPGASRPGDEQMSCEQIVAEARQQSYAAPDRAKVAEAQSAAIEVQKTNAKNQAEITAIAARQQVSIDAAMASDRAAEMATLGVVRPNTAAALEQAYEQQNRATGERMARERAPTDRRLMDSTAGLVGDAAAQLQANPRMARLIQLARARHCKNL